MNKVLRRPVLRGATIVGLAGALLLSGASPAMADTSQATANAITANLGTAGLLNTGTCAASSDGTTVTVVPPCTPSTSLLNGQTVITAGALIQTATAANNGTSAACAGLLGTGGTVDIGTNPPCSGAGLVPGTGGITLLNGAITIEGIIARCTASSTGPTGPNATGSVDIVNLRAGLGIIPLFNGPAAPNTGLNIPGVATLLLNEQPTPQAAGTFRTTALHLTVLGSVVDISIGNVMCGPNAAAVVPPVIPLAGIPFALATAAVVGGGVVYTRRRRQRAGAASVA